jgi:DNA primase
MAWRIPEAFIQDLLARTDIVELIGSRLELKRAGREFKARSPFTNEKTPSFYVSPTKQMFFDFSSGKNGTAISFLMEYDRLSFVEAVEELARRAGIEVPREGGVGERVVMDGPLDALAAAQRFFRDKLKNAPGAIEYLKKRGVTGETARTFGIGFAPDAWDALSGFLQNTTHAVDAGLLKRKEGTDRVYDVFRNRIMFPIRDTRGRVIAFGGRTLGDDPAKYLNSPETALFHKGRNLYGLYEARESTRSALPYLIVVEGYMDVVMLAQHGIREVVGTLGTATTREHLNLLFKSTQKIVFCFDGDRAGRAAAARALEQALPELYDQRECAFMFLPEGHDPDTLVQEIGAEEFRRRVAAAQPLAEFLMHSLARQADLGTMDGRARLAALARPHLARLREGPLRALVLDELARLTRLSRTDLEQLARAEEAPARMPAAATAHREAAAGATRVVKRALQLLLEQPALWEQVEHVEQLAEADAPGLRLLIEALDYFHAHPGARAAQLIEFWRDQPRKAEAVQRLLNEEITLVESAMAHDEFHDAIARLRDRALRRRVQHLVEQGLEQPPTEAAKQEMRVLTRLRKKTPPAPGG